MPAAARSAERARSGPGITKPSIIMGWIEDPPFLRAIHCSFLWDRFSANPNATKSIAILCKIISRGSRLHALKASTRDL